MLIITTLLVIAYWLVACISNVFFFSKESFYQEFFYPEPVELIKRITVIVFIVTIGVLFNYLSARKKKIENILEDVLGLRPTALNIINSLVIILDDSGKVVGFNEASEGVTGYDFSQVQDKYIWKFFPNPDEAKYIKQEFSRFDPATFPQTYQSRWRTKNGKIKLFHWSNKIILNNKGQPKFVVSTGFDLSVFQQTAEVQKQSEKEYKNIIDNIGIGICLVSKDAKRLYTNKQMDQWFPNSQVIKHSICHDIMSQDPIPTCSVCPSCQSLKDGQVHKTIIKVFRDNLEVSYKIVTFPIKDRKNEVVAAIEMVEDFTEMNQKEEEIRRSYLVQAVMNSLLRFSLENISLNDFLDCSLNIILSTPWFSAESRGAVYLTGNDPEVLELRIQKKISKDIEANYGHIPFGNSALGVAASSGIPQFVNYSLDHGQTNNDPYKSYAHYCVPIICSGMSQGVMDIYLASDHERDKREEEFLVATANTLAGVIKRKKAEEQVSKINEGFISLGVEPLANIQRLVILCGDILGAGFAIYNRFDYTQDAFYAAGQYNAAPTDLEALKPYEQMCRNIIKKNYEKIFVLDDLSNNQEFSSDVNVVECKFKTCMGQAVKCRGKPIGVIAVFYRNDFIPGEEAKKFLGIIIAAIGIEEERIKANLELKEAYEKLKKAQFGLVQSEKMAALGRFSSGIAHEVKNPLGIILGGIEFLERKLVKADKDVQTAARKIKEATLRADHIIRNLLRFAMPSEIRTEVINPKDLLNDTLSFFKYRASLVNVDIITEFPRENIYIRADKNQIQQVLFNLLMNASEAITEEGQISIKLYKVASFEADSTKEGCVIEIIDTGEGIEKEYLSKLFEPFFTTKRDKKGTGLGLSISKMIVENHKGTLAIDGEPGKGTCAKVTFPVAEKE